MDEIKQLIIDAFQWLKIIFKRVINGILNFTRDVLNWFRNLQLDPNKHTPFIADKSKLKEMLKTAPVKDVGVFKGVYNEQTDEIEHHELIEADALDSETKNILGREALVVLK